MARPRRLSDARAFRAIQRAIQSGKTSHAALSQQLGVSLRTMARYIQRYKAGAKTCPCCHGSGFVRALKGQGRDAQARAGTEDEREQ